MVVSGYVPGRSLESSSHLKFWNLIFAQPKLLQFRELFQILNGPQLIPAKLQASECIFDRSVEVTFPDACDLVLHKVDCLEVS